MSNSHKPLNESVDFSLVLGGPLYQIFLRTHLAKPPLDLFKRRIIFITLFTWLPLLLLSIISGVAFSGVKIPFIFDIETHVRFLGALGLFIVAELFVHQRIQFIVVQFLERDIIATEDRSRFHDIISSAMRLRNSVIVELLLIVFVITLGRLIWKEYTIQGVATWYAIPSESISRLTLAGYWYTFVSLPIFQFIFLRWYFRLLVWYRFLWQVSRLPLRLNSLHPDRAGGLGFLENSVYAFGLLLIAHTILLSGALVNRIWHGGATLPQFYVEILGVILFLMLIVLTPLFFFIIRLAEAKRIGTRNYGSVASRYVDNFRQKWIDEGLEKGKQILGTSDIQSLADLSNSFAVTNEMRLLPFSRRVVSHLLIIIALPLFPLVLTMIPLEQMINQLFKMFL